MASQRAGEIPCLQRNVRLVASSCSTCSLLVYSVSTLRSAIELKSVFDQIQAAEKAGNLSPEEKKKLEESAAEKGLQALFKVRCPLSGAYIVQFTNVSV